jgi:hypothetical protein
MVEPIILFERWFVQPLVKLRELPNGDGGFVALATSCFLYERYAVAVIMKLGGKANQEGKIEQFTTDFDVDKITATNFWAVIRDGILHQGMPKTNEQRKRSLPNWMIRSGYKPVWMGRYKGSDTLFVDPWLFTDKVLQLWNNNPSLIDQNKSFPWANVVPIAVNQKEEQ